MRRKKKIPVDSSQESKQNTCMAILTSFAFDAVANTVTETYDDGSTKTLTEGVTPVAPTITEIDVPFTDGSVQKFVKAA